MSDEESNTMNLGRNDTVYVYIAGCWVSGIVENTVGDVVAVKTVTGNVVRRMKNEVSKLSPRLTDASVWPV